MFLLKKLDSRTIKIFDINFKKPWWNLITRQGLLFPFIIFAMIVVHGFWFVTPFLIEILFQSPTVLTATILFISWVGVDCLHLYARALNGRFQLQCIHSIYKNAHTHLLTIDPLYHIHRSSGSLLAKIERGARGYEELLDQVTFELVPLFVGLTIMVIALFRQSPLLALFEAFLFIIMITFSFWFARYKSQQWERVFIKSDDTFKQTAVENLAQVHMVRALFASDYMNDLLNKRVQNNSETERLLWFAYACVAFILNALYFCSILILLTFLAYQIKQGTMTVTSALSLAIAYTQSTKAIVSVTSRFRRYIRGWTGVKDLFESMAQFGAQSFPVLGPVEQTHNAEKNQILVEADSISFNYETAQLFNEHTLCLMFSPEQHNKLIGIIGASGTGKSTLLSILGGQIKPTSGTVKINGIDIYTINDATRRMFIALQGQIATSVKGTVKYNMLFGLPDNHGFDDAFLLNILNRVDLLTILQKHDGLNTMLGEGGLSFSGGQRQRLNFAALYIRALFYKPSLILIDEPTSSLDEVSEESVTGMIMELAQKAITLVIAHRLKTIEDAVGIIDLSLLKDEKEIKVRSAQELEQCSSYYQQLREGKIALND